MGAVLPHIATVLVAIIAAWAAISTQRQASRANQSSLIEASRSDMEKEAYERARTFDTETIIRQNRMIDELHEDVDKLRLVVRDQRRRLEQLEGNST